MAKKQEQIVNNSRVIREFGYALGGLVLNFSLNINSKKDLENFKQLMVAGLKDLEEEIAKHQ